MTTATLHVPPQASTARAAKSGKSFLRTVYDAIIEAQTRRAERLVASHRHLLPAELEEAGLRLGSRNEDSLPFRRP